MTRRFSLRRGAGLLLAAGLLFVLAGDRGITATPLGIDPLEILNLQIKPNVIVILDNSGSMAETPYTRTQYGGDHTGSKLYLAKQVLKSVFQANQTKAQFMFGNYRYASAYSTVSNMTTTANTTPALGNAANRFFYSTQSWAAGTFANPACTVDPTSCPTPNPANVTLGVQGPSPSMAGTAFCPTCQELSLNGLFAYQWIRDTANPSNPAENFVNNQLVFSEATGPTNCVATIPAGFYTGTTLAAAIQTAMSTASCSPARVNTYTVTYGAGTGQFTFSRNTGTSDFTLQWNLATSTIRGVLAAGTTARTVTGTNTRSTGDARINLLARTTGNDITESYDPDGASTTLTPALDKPSPKRNVTTYFLFAQKFWNGQTVYVDSTGNACDVQNGTATNPPTVNLQLTTTCANGRNSADAANRVTFTWSGGQVAGNGACQGFMQQVPLIPCNQTSPPQFDGIAPFLENELPLDANGSIKGYTESTDGTGNKVTNPSAGGLLESGNTPLAESLDDIRAIFGGGTYNGTAIPGLWAGGQAAAPGPPPVPALDPIKNHLNPKEKTIVLMVTDGAQNCGVFSGETDAAVWGAAAAAQKLYNPAANGTGAGTVNADGTINGDPAAAVTTYVIAFGGTTTLKRQADWIAWGGSGMMRTLGTSSGLDTWTSIPTQAERDACKTCVDSFLAPDPDTLKAVLETVINQGASTGEFTAQQSLTDSVFELSGDVPQGTAPRPWSPMNPRNRYDPLIPNRFVSTFSLPLFTGQIRAYTQGGPASLATAGADCAFSVLPDFSVAGNACQRWNANDRLVARVTSGMSAQCPAITSIGVAASQCNFAKLWGASSTTDSNISTSNAAIKRRIYTTSQNGVFGPTVDQLINGQSPFRISIWPPQATNPGVAPASDTQQGLLDAALGLPLDSAASPSAELTTLQNQFKACKGSNLPTSCTGGSTLTQMQRARREAREMILAFLAGAQFVADGSGSPTRATGPSGSYALGDILYLPRTQILAESTVATPAVIAPPQEEEPTDFVTEYDLYRDGPRSHTTPSLEPDGQNPDNGALIKSGFGLRNPDRDGNNVVVGVTQGRQFYADDTRTALKPVMTVLYAGTNSALHAFRAGPSVRTTITTACAPTSSVECGGEELWAFVPFDGLRVLKSRYLNNPQKRDPHDYMIARGIRFSDVFVPNPGTAQDAGTNGTVVTRNLAGVTYSMQGVWRKVMFFGRGIGGKFMTAIDVTAPGPFTSMSLDATGPIVLWSRGNPDTVDGTASGTKNNTLEPNDFNVYATMGQTWSVPAVGYVGRGTVRSDDTNNPPGLATRTTRKPSGVDFVLFMGSGYGGPGEGTTFYSLDALTGDVIASKDVEQVVQSSFTELTRSGLPYANALVANPVVFNRSRFIYSPGGVKSPNVAAARATRVYIGDLFGRLWKFLPAAPTQAIPAADLGSDQPVATAASLLGLPANDPASKPYVYVTSGNDNRATGSFHNFGFLDNGDETSYLVSAPVTANGVKTYPPMVSQFTITFESGFKGTVQPATAYSETSAGLGRVFFGGTRFNAPNTPNAPPVPPYPCRSSFDSILYAVGAETGLAAYDLPSGLSYMIFQDSRIVALSTEASPREALLAKDEGLAKAGAPISPPPEMGLAPTTQSTQNVIPVAGLGLPTPAVRFGSTVCQ